MENFRISEYKRHKTKEYHVEQYIEKFTFLWLSCGGYWSTVKYEVCITDYPEDRGAIFQSLKEANDFLDELIYLNSKSEFVEVIK